MISALAALMLQAAAPAPAAPAATAPGRPARAEANLAGLFSDSDYPADALREGKEGTTEFRLRVGRDGLVTGCAIIASSGSVSLDHTTCRLLTARARFSPARDRRGRPVTDSIVGRISWRLGDLRLLPFEALWTVSTSRVTPAGESSCSATVNGVPHAVPRCPDPGAQMVKTARLAGRTVERTMVTIFSPEGEPEPVAPEDHGIQMVETAVSVGIAPDGSVLECEVLLNEPRGPGADNAPNPCRAFVPGRKLFRPVSAGTGAGPRRMNVTVRAYSRR